MRSFDSSRSAWLRWSLASIVLVAVPTAFALVSCSDDSVSTPSNATLSSGSGDKGTGGMGQVGGPKKPEARTLTILETSDLHTNIYPWDYFSAKEDAKRGLAKIATLVKQERSKNPECSLLLDSGDTIQGTPLGTYYALVDKAPVHPMAVAMNLLGYDAMALGNHEFNYGLDLLGKFQKEVKFPILGANVRKKMDGAEAFTPYVVKDVCGIKVGILGMVTVGVTTWERPENIPGLVFEDMVSVAQRYVHEMRTTGGADVIVLSVHGGPDKQPPGNSANPNVWLSDRESWRDRGNLPGENQVIQLAEQVEGIDVILSGHTHQPIPKMLVNGVLITQPNRWGSHLAKVTLSLEERLDGWKTNDKDATLLPVEGVTPDAEVTSQLKTYHEATVAYVDSPIGSSQAAIPGGYPARYTDSALADLINTVQMDAAAQNGFPVDISLAAIFTNDGSIPAGQVRLRDAYSVYIYDNTLYVMEINGDVLRRALEKDAAYFKQLTPGNLPAKPEDCKADPAGPDFNWDIYSGIDYTFDLTKPLGQRLIKLQFQGKDVKMDQSFRIAINNYRAGGGGGFVMFQEGKILWQSADGVRDFMSAYIAKHPNLNPAELNTCNFALVPDLYAAYFDETPGKVKCSM